MPSFSINEKTSGVYYATLVDESGALVGPTVLSALTLTLYDKVTGSIINSRNAQNVKNANNVTVFDTLQMAADGVTTFNLAWALQPLDGPIVTDSNAVETHIALFQATWAAGAKALKFEVQLLVKNLWQVT